jgi:hypothetical protein
VKLHGAGALSNVVMIGDKRKFNTALITLRQVVLARSRCRFE